jgi:hypothetical protein
MREEVLAVLLVQPHRKAVLISSFRLIRRRRGRRTAVTESSAEHQGSDRAAVGGPDVSGPTGRGMGRHPAAGAGHVDAVSPGWLPAVVSLQRPDQLPVLREGRSALRRSRAFCVPKLLRLGIRKPTKISAYRGLAKARKVRARLGGSANMFDDLPGSTEGHALANLPNSTPFSRYRCGC